MGDIMEEGNNKYRSFKQIVNLIYNESLDNLDDKSEKYLKTEKKIKI